MTQTATSSAFSINSMGEAFRSNGTELGEEALWDGEKEEYVGLTPAEQVVLGLWQATQEAQGDHIRVYAGVTNGVPYLDLGESLDLVNGTEQEARVIALLESLGGRMDLVFDDIETDGGPGSQYEVEIPVYGKTQEQITQVRLAFERGLSAIFDGEKVKRA